MFLMRNYEFFILRYYYFLIVYCVAISNLLPDAPSAIAHETTPYPFKNLLSEFLFLSA